MANISQEVNIEMLEKLADGSYKKKNPQTKASQVIAEDGSNLESHLADNATIKHKGKEIGLEDTANNFTNKNVEGAMGELFTNVSNGKDLVGGAITGVDDSVVIPTDPTFGDLASAIGGISTGKKIASGTGTTYNGYDQSATYIGGSTFQVFPLVVSGMSFKPRLIIAKAIARDVYSVYASLPSLGFSSNYYPKVNMIFGYNTSGRFVTDTQAYSYAYKADVAPLYVNSTGFTIACAGKNLTYEWIAFE